MTIRDLNRLSTLELELAVRGARANETLEYMNMLNKTNMISQENQGLAIYVSLSAKNDPAALRVASEVLEMKKQREFDIYREKTLNLPPPPSAAQNEQPEETREKSAGLLTALKCAVDIAVYRAQAAVAAINNSVLKRSVQVLEKVQREMIELEELKEQSRTLKNGIKTIGKQPPPSAQAAPVPVPDQTFPLPVAKPEYITKKTLPDASTGEARELPQNADADAKSESVKPPAETRKGNEKSNPAVMTM